LSKRKQVFTFFSPFFFLFFLPVSSKWLASFYKKDQTAKFNKWEHIEQERIFQDATLAHRGLRGCLKALAKSREPRLDRLIDFYEKFLEYMPMPAGPEADKKACEIYTGFLKDDKKFKDAEVAALGEVGNVCGTKEKPNAKKIISGVAKKVQDAIRAKFFSKNQQNFRSSTHYKGCADKNIAEKEIHNYAAIADEFCTHEGNAYVKGSEPRKIETEAILCAHDPLIFKKVMGQATPA
jgi:predicted transposase YbfD/YdcC